MNRLRRLQLPSGRWTTVVVAVVIGLLAAVIRIRMIQLSGWLSIGGYDDGVHFAAAANLVHGRVLYQDVAFLQPPGMALVAAPFAALAEVIGDAKAFGGARLAFALLGGVNAALVVLVARRLGLVAAVVAGVLYAVSFPAVYVERTLTLEAVGTVTTLLALLCLDAMRHGRPHRWALVGGVVAGTALGVKIWYVVPFAVLLLFARGGRVRFLLGGVLGGAAVYLPFFLRAPGAMWDQVVIAQLGRPASNLPFERRLRAVLGVTAPGSISPFSHVSSGTVAVVLGVVAVALVLLALSDRRARVLVVLLLACFVTLMVSPSFFQHYTAFTAAPLALVAGAGVQRIGDLLPGRWPAVAAVLVAVVLAVALNVHHDGMRQNDRAPVRALRDAAASIHGCIVADDPTVLILMNRLTPDLDAGCTVQPDPSGVGYLLADAQGRRGVARLHKPAYQREILRYLWSGSAYLWIRGDGLQLTPATIAQVERGPVLFREGRWVLRATPAH